jgi:hypothetical protein
MALSFLQNPLAGDGVHRRRKSASERRTGEACASRAPRGSPQPVAARRGRRIRSIGIAAASRSGRGSGRELSGDPRECAASPAATRATAPGAAIAAAARGTARQARPPPLDAPTERSDITIHAHRSAMLSGSSKSHALAVSGSSVGQCASCHTAVARPAVGRSRDCGCGPKRLAI